MVFEFHLDADDGVGIVVLHDFLVKKGAAGGGPHDRATTASNTPAQKHTNRRRGTRIRTG
jgi:hypothetical protein